MNIDKKYHKLLDVYCDRIVDIFDNLLIDQDTCLSSETEDSESGNIGLSGDFPAIIKNDVQLAIEEFLNELHDDKLIDGDIFEGKAMIRGDK